MEKRFLALLTGAALLLSSCAAMNHTNEESEYEDLTPISEVAEEAADFTPTDYDNLTFKQEKISIYVPENLSHCTLQQVGCFDLAYGDQLLHYWIPDEVWDDQYATAWNEGEEAYYYAFSSQYNQVLEDGTPWYAAVWCTGSVFYYKGDGEARNYHEPEAGSDRIYNVLADDLSGSVDLIGGTVQLTDLVELAQTYADDWLAQTDLQITLRPKYLCICREDNLQKFAKVVYQTCYNGVPISGVAVMYQDRDGNDFEYPSEENGYTGDVALRSMDASMISGEELDSFGTGNGSVVLYDEGTVCENMISMSKACEILSEQLTGYGAQEIEDVALEYRLTITGSDQPEDTYRFFDEITGELLPDRSGVQNFWVSYDLYDATPYWAFYASDRLNRELIFYVNCITGEIQILDNQPY